jgi:light-regulated signal transduction histidine kinase (bacteriophytochrome)
MSELESYREALRVTTDGLQRANSDLEQFSWLADHELQEPLRMVTLFNQLLKEKYGNQLDSQADEFIRYSIEGASRIQMLVHDLVEYTRSANILNGNSPEVVEVLDLINGAVATIREAIDRTGAKVKSGLMPRLRTQAAPLQQVFQHLISNAIKFSREVTPTVTISAVARKGDWLFSVADNGIGIDPRYRQHIFGLFKRLQPASEYPGSGVGLAICKRIVELLRGVIWVESEPGQGATFFFTLPRGL